jgi:hypothetical protein
MEMGPYTITIAEQLARITFAGPFGAVHVGTLSLTGLERSLAAARGTTPPPGPGTPERGKWAGRHATGFLEALREQAMVESTEGTARPYGAHRTQAERDAILVAWSSWTSSRAAFCRAHGVSAATLRRWLGRAWQARGPGWRCEMIPVVVRVTSCSDCPFAIDPGPGEGLCSESPIDAWLCSQGGECTTEGAPPTDCPLRSSSIVVALTEDV